MPKRVAYWLLRLYPLAWRERYAVEVVALLEQHQVTVRTLVDLGRGAIEARLHAQDVLESLTLPIHAEEPSNTATIDRLLIGAGGCLLVGTGLALLVGPTRSVGNIAGLTLLFAILDLGPLAAIGTVLMLLHRGRSPWAFYGAVVAAGLCGFTTFLISAATYNTFFEQEPPDYQAGPGWWGGLGFTVLGGVSVMLTLVAAYLLNSLRAQSRQTAN
jgi:hypothetical protein